MCKPRPYILLAAALLGVYVLAAIALLATKDFDDTGPLSLHEPAVESVPAAVAGQCYPRADRVKVVAGEVRGRPYYACYELDGEDGSVLEAKVVDGQGFAVTDAGLVKEAGARPRPPSRRSSSSPGSSCSGSSARAPPPATRGAWWSTPCSPPAWRSR